MSILDIVAFYEARRISLRWANSEPKFSEMGPINWALLPKILDRNTQRMKAIQSFNHPKPQRFRDEPCRASH